MAHHPDLPEKISSVNLENMSDDDVWSLTVYLQAICFVPREQATLRAILDRVRQTPALYEKMRRIVMEGDRDWRPSSFALANMMLTA